MRSNKQMGVLGVLLGATLMVGGSPAFAEYGLNMTEGVTSISQEVYGLHMLIFYVCCAIALVVFGVMFYSIFKHRKSVGATPAQFHESTAVELVWTVVPFLILISMAIPATKSLIQLEDASEADLTIKVTGYQWKWQYEYPEEKLSFFSTLDAESNKARQLNSGVDVSAVPDYLRNVDHPLVIPTGKKVRFLITSNDVNHAWWVPDLGWKKDAIPGFINEAWTRIDKPGTYRGQCAELCGRDHGFMPIVLIAKTPEEYEAWVKEKQGGSASAAVENESNKELVLAANRAQ